MFESNEKIIVPGRVSQNNQKSSSKECLQQNIIKTQISRGYQKQMSICLYYICKRLFFGLNLF